MNDNNDLMLKRLEGIKEGSYGVRKSIPVIIREKICSPDPDMYIIIAFMGILLASMRFQEVLRL